MRSATGLIDASVDDVTICIYIRIYIYVYILGVKSLHVSSEYVYPFNYLHIMVKTVVTIFERMF